MNWHDQPIPTDDEGNPKFEGRIALTNDKNETLGGICWFYDVGPFYAYAMDVDDTSLTRRIGPCTTLEGAKAAVEKAIEGGIRDLSKRAGYPRE